MDVLVSVQYLGLGVRHLAKVIHGVGEIFEDPESCIVQHGILHVPVYLTSKMTSLALISCIGFQLEISNYRTHSYDRCPKQLIDIE